MIAGRRSKLQSGHCANPAALEAWKGYEWAKALDESALYATKENAAMMVKYIKDHKSDGPSCLFLSLLAFCTAPTDFFDQKWGEVLIERVDRLIGCFVRATRTAIVVYFLGRDGRLTGQRMFGKGCEHGGALAIIPAGNGVIHALPLAKPTAKAIAVPAAILEDIRCDSATEVQSAAPDREPEVPAVRTVGSASTQVAAARPASEVVPPVQPIAREKAEKPILYDFSPQRIGPFLWPPKDGVYVGPGAPPKWFIGEWVAGFMATEIRDVSLMRQWLYKSVVRPQLASAALSNFRRYGTTLYYSDVTLGSTVARVGRRKFTDGHTEDDYFTAGDRLVADGCTWDVLRVKWDGHPVLEVRPTNITTRVFGESARAQVEPAIGDVDSGEVFKARCTAMRLTRTDPVETALATRWMGDWAASGYDVTGDPDDVATIASAVARQYRSVGSVGGGYGWGKCYSCGGQLTGKSRICCRGVNSPLARMIAAGEKVTSLAIRVLYPGVVWCRSQHPPLKAGVETNATDQNFR